MDGWHLFGVLPCRVLGHQSINTSWKVVQRMLVQHGPDALALIAIFHANVINR